ncbi:MAG: alpha/beta hydrolase [bacterium]
MPQMTINGFTMDYDRFGSKDQPTVVLVHGITCDSSDWAAQGEHLQQNYDVIAVNLNGHGRSATRLERCTMNHYAEDIVAITEQLAVSPAILVGHSMGSRVVLQAAVDRPDLFKSVVLVDGSRLADPESLNTVISNFQSKIESTGYGPFMQAFFEHTFFDDVRTELKNRVIDRAMRFEELKGVTLFKEIMRWDANFCDIATDSLSLPVFAIQTTSIADDGSRIPLQLGQRNAWLELLERKLKKLNITVIPGAGHFPMLDHPGLFNSRLEKILQTV